MRAEDNISYRKTDNPTVRACGEEIGLGKHTNSDSVRSGWEKALKSDGWRVRRNIRTS